MTLVLRDFLYLNRDLVRSLLAQVEGGVFDEATETESTTGKGNLGGRLGAGPMGLEAGKSKESSVSREATVKQVAASEFDRLHRYLEEESGLVVLDDVAEAKDASEIRRQQFLEIDARIEAAGMDQLFDLIETMSNLMPMMDKFSDEPMDKETREGIAAIAALRAGGGTIGTIARVPGGAAFKAALELDPEWSLTDRWDVEASVLLKVQRVIKGSDTYLVGDPFQGLLSKLPAKERKNFTDAMNAPELAALGVGGDLEITAPAVVGTPIAIWR